MHSERFWANLARGLCPTPGIEKIAYPLGNLSTVELMRWTLRRMRARDRWTSDRSGGLRVRWRIVDGGILFCGAEFLRGGRWLFTIQDDGEAHIIDLAQKNSCRHFLFKTYRSFQLTDFLRKFRIWVDETKQELSFRVATYDPDTDGKG